MKLSNIFYHLLAICACVGNLAAQNSTSSPYSIYGIGDLDAPVSIEALGMGGTTYGTVTSTPNYSYWGGLPPMNSSARINFANPSTYSYLSTPTFTSGISTNKVQMTFGTQKANGSSTYFKNMILGFPVSKRWGSAFGIIPYSRMGYEIEDAGTIEGFGNVDYVYRGEGNLSKFFIGNSYSLINKSNATLSLGANAAYLFGALTKSRRVWPQDGNGAYNLITSKVTSVNDFSFDLGANYYFTSENDSLRLSIGGAITLGDDVNLKQSKIVQTYEATFNDQGLETAMIFKDTILNDTSVGSMYVPMKIGLGFSIELNRQWVISADYTSQDWSKFTVLGVNGGLAKSEQFAVGVQFVPAFKIITKLLSIMNYRAGFRVATTRLFIDAPVKEFAASVGLGIPLIRSKSNSSINFGMELGQRGSVGAGQVVEKFVNAQFGFSFTPAMKYDPWFKKRKIE